MIGFKPLYILSLIVVVLLSVIDMSSHGRTKYIDGKKTKQPKITTFLKKKSNNNNNNSNQNRNVNRNANSNRNNSNINNSDSVYHPNLDYEYDLCEIAFDNDFREHTSEHEVDYTYEYNVRL
eukprot:127321_1